MRLAIHNSLKAPCTATSFNPGLSKQALDEKLRAYAMTGVLFFAMGPAAHGGVIYSGPQNVSAEATKGVSHGISIDLDADGIMDYSVEAYVNDTNTGVRMESLGANESLFFDLGAPLISPYVEALSFGDPVEAITAPLLGWNMKDALLLDLDMTGPLGIWPNSLSDSRYLAVRFDTSSYGRTYGWVQIGVGLEFDQHARLRLLDWAFTNNGNGMMAGTLQEIDAASTPEPSSLALLASGAIGLVALRERRRKARIV